jgi:hypothetical protein
MLPFSFTPRLDVGVGSINQIDISRELLAAVGVIAHHEPIVILLQNGGWKLEVGIPRSAGSHEDGSLRRELAKEVLSRYRRNTANGFGGGLLIAVLGEPALIAFQ